VKEPTWDAGKDFKTELRLLLMEGIHHGGGACGMPKAVRGNEKGNRQLNSLAKAQRTQNKMETVASLPTFC
jgi:isopentenyl phosphate kinase